MNSPLPASPDQPHTPEAHVPDRISLSTAQRGIWYAQKLAPTSPMYQIGQFIDISGPLNGKILDEAVSRAVAETPALNVGFGEDQDGPFQYPLAAAAAVQFTDLGGAASSMDGERSARDLMDSDMSAPRAVSDNNLLHMELIRLSPTRHFFYQRVHHLLLDGYSAVLVLRRVAALYGELLAEAADDGAHEAAAAADSTGSPHELPDFGQFTDLIADDQSYADSAAATADATYWAKELDGAATPAGLAGRPEGTASSLLRSTVELPASAVMALESAPGSAPALILTAVSLYLHRMTGEQNVSLALPVTARRGKLAKSTPSMLSNIVPVRLNMAPGATVQELVAAMGGKLRNSLIHQRARYESMSGQGGYLGPSVNILPVLEDITFGTATGTMNILSTGPIDDLSVIVHGMGQGPSGSVTVQFAAAAELYTQPSLDQHLNRFVQLLGELLTHPAEPTAALSVTTDAEEKSLLAAGDAPALDLPGHTVAEEFAKVAASAPDRTAVVATDGTLTFAQLEARSNQLARFLRGRGAKPGTTVAVRLDRSVLLPVSILGILKSGAAYVPLDPDYPAGRVEGMLEDAAPVLLLTTAAMMDDDAEEQPQTSVPVTVLDSALMVTCLDGKEESALARIAGQQDLAYVIFTSGSTGRPKGVGVEHLALLNLLTSHRESIFDPAQAALGRHLRVAHTAGLSFDASWDPILWLLAGHELHMVDNQTRRDPEALSSFLAAERIDSIETTPSFAKALLAGGLFDQQVHPTVVALGGEAVDPATWRELATHDGVMAYNFYGPTETTVDSLTAVMDPGTDVTLGDSVANTRHYILDSGLNPVPTNAIGELYVAGVNLARGYLDKPGLSSEKFVADPFATDGSRMYRTGDVVRRLEHGTLQFLGRMDQQIKIRGFRIEPAEIEAVLRGMDGVDQAAVTVSKNRAGYDQLLAYVTTTNMSTDAAESGDLDTAALRAQARRTLPDYMVPTAIIVIGSIPLTANGKLDARALPAPVQDTAMTAPRTDAETLVAECFREILGLEAVGVDDDFFELGGHSLLATRLAALLRERTGSAPALRTIFEEPTVAGLAAALETDSSAVPELSVTTRPATIPLSFAQRRLWFLNRMDQESGAYNIPVVLTLKGTLDVTALAEALSDVVLRHESLRTVFPWLDGEPHQSILSPHDAPVNLLAVQCDPDSLDRALRTETERGFDITTELPLRTVLFQLAPDYHVLAITLHHVAADGWSLAPLARDLSTAYTARLEGSTPAADALPVQYADYTLWQRQALGSEDDPASPISRQLEFWSRELKGSPEELRLPLDFARGTREGDAPASSIPLELDATTTARLNALARTHNASLFMVLQAALAALLTKNGAGEDIPLGTPVAGRTDTRLNELVGFFVNTLVLRTNTSGNPTAAELVESVRYTNLHAYGNQDAPFERVVEEVNPARSRHRHPLFQVMLTLQNTPDAELAMAGLDVSADLGRDPGGAKFDLLLDLAEREGTGITGSLAYNPALFTAATVAQLAAGFTLVAQQFAADPKVTLDRLQVLNAAERDAVLEHAAPTVLDLPWATIPEAFTLTARARAGQIALVAGSGADATSLSFAQLDDRVSGLAAGLAAAGITAGDRVAVALPRSADVVASALAIFAAGAVYVPVDLSYPAERIRMILEDSAPALVITNDAGITAARSLTVSEVLAAGGPTPVGGGLPGVPAAVPAPEDLAYVLYTSGSTGRPKGVAVTHGALANLYAHHHATLFAPRFAAGGSERVRVAHIAGLGFDASWDPMLWMVAGAELHLVSDAVRSDAESLAQYCLDNGIDVVETTPSYAAALLECGLLSRARTEPLILALGGEAVSGELWQRLAAEPAVQALNFYGPTEFTVDSVMATIVGSRPVIGRPAGNTAAMVLDAYLQPVPAGVPGELYLAGAGMARGYDQRPGETASRFVANPFAGDGSRMYRTGDLVRRDSNGVLEFLSRTDDQVKVRGFRIELGEIEAALAAHPQVQHVVAIPDGDPAQRIVAYIVGDVDAAQLRTTAAEKLPDYMVPAVFMSIPALPLTSHGKLDRRALPAPSAATAAGNGVPPSTPEEHVMAGIFGEVLDLDTVTMDDDFFLLGGHSLLAITIMGKIRESFGTALPLRALFDSPTPAALLTAVTTPAGQDTEATGQEVSTAHSGLTHATIVGSDIPALADWMGTASAARPDQLVLSFAQQRMWFLNQLEPGSSEYNISLAARLTGELDEDAMSAAIDALLARHEILRTTYPATAGIPHQQISPAQHATGLLWVIPVGSAEEEARQLADGAGRGFDLTAELPFRATLLRRTDTPGTWVLHMVLNHIASDGASLAPLTRDLSEAYAAALAGAEAIDRAPLAVQYADFSTWQQQALGSGDSSTDSDAAGASTSPHGSKLEHWKEALAGIPAEMALPADHRRPREARQPGRQQHFTLDAETLVSLQKVAASANASLFMTLHAVLAGFLHRSGAGEDLVIGSPTAGRTDPALTELVGFFVNTLPLRISAAGDPTLRTLVGRARGSILAAFDHDDVPFERLVEVLNPERELGRHPLFQTMLTVDSTVSAIPELPGVQVTTVPESASGEAKFDLSFTFRPAPVQEDPAGTVEPSAASAGASEPQAGLSATLEYNSEMFEEASIQRLISAFVRFVERSTANADTPITDLVMVDPAEAEALAASTAGSTSSTTGEGTTAANDGVLSTFAATVAAQPAATALVADGAERTFGELAKDALGLAVELANAGVGHGDVVSVFLPRSSGTVQALLGVIAGAGVYNPIDTEYPDSRIIAILEDARPPVILSTASQQDRLELLLTTMQPEAADPAGVAARSALPRIVLLEDLLAAARAGVSAPSGETGHRSSQSMAWTDVAAELRNRQPADRELAYVMFTSGSTGRPKGVDVSHGALAALYASHRETLLFGFDPSATIPGIRRNVAHTTGVGFDASWDPTLWLIAGHCLHMIDDSTRRDAAALATYFADHSITAWETTPGYVRQLLKEPAFMRILDGVAAKDNAGGTKKSSRPVEPGTIQSADTTENTHQESFSLALGGEAFDAELWELLAAKSSVTTWNMYGPTEAAVDTVVARVSDSTTPVLGAPTSGTRLHVLDSRLRPVLAGTAGELYIAGRQLARGYRGRPDLTAERFIADPFAANGERMYRTGDLVTRHEDGRLIFAGRNDDQLKIRGFRVEPGEIERAAVSAPGVASAVVRAVTEKNGNVRLLAYVVPDATDTASSTAVEEGHAAELAESVRTHLRTMLPDYMVPAAVVVLAEIPLTPHGKVDLKALPAAADAPRAAGKPPRSPREKTVAAIFADVLSVERVGVDESFFELGGHSFLAQPLIAKINTALGTSLQVQSLFRAPTVEDLLRVASQGTDESAAADLRQVLTLRGKGKKSPLFAVHPASGISWGYASMLGSLDPERPLVGLQMPGMEPNATHTITATTLTELADQYIEQIRSVQPAGPYHLMGWSFGGHLVHRLATRLQELGEDVATLTILDAFPGTQENNDDVGTGAALWASYLDAQGYSVDAAEAATLDAVRAQEILRENHNPLGTVPLDSVQAMVENFPVLARLIRTQEPAVFAGDLLLFRATKAVPAGTPGAESWAPYVSGTVTEVDVPDRHSQMLSDIALPVIMPSLAIQLGTESE